MFAEPTLDDFASWLGWHLDRAMKECAREITAVSSRFAGAGAYPSSRASLAMIDAADNGLEQALENSLGELKRTLQSTALDKTELRRIAEEKLSAFVRDLKARLHPTKAMLNEPAVKRRQAELDGRLALAWRHFDVGLLNPSAPEVPPTMANHIQIGSMSGGTLQQGANNKIENISLVINIPAAEVAISSLEAALPDTLPAESRAEVQSDLDTIKAQLGKAVPSKSIIAEAAASVRSVLEGVLAGALTPPAVAAAASLWAALGM